MSTPSRIGVIHTSPATVDLFGRLLKDRVPGATIVDLLDDSILTELRDNGGDLSAVEPRWRLYARIMSERGVDIILNACSSIGELCARVQPEIPRRIVRVDAGVARAAVSRASTVSVLATLASTLRPTSDLIREAAQEAGRSITLDSTLVDGAYPALMAGGQARHDDLVAAALDRASRASDVVVLAQASMARVVPRLPDDRHGKIVTSPSYAVEDVVNQLRLNATS